MITRFKLLTVTADVPVVTELPGPARLHATLAALAELPLWGPWVARWPAATQRAVANKLHVTVEDAGGNSRDLAVRAGWERAATLIDAGDFQAAFAQANRRAKDEGEARYSLALLFIFHRETGELVGGWPGVRLKVMSDTIADALPDDWTAPAFDALVRICGALEARLGSVRYHEFGDESDPFGYSRDHYGPPGEPDAVPGAAWLSLLPPLVVERLGGPERIAAGPVHRVESITYGDGGVASV